MSSDVAAAFDCGTSPGPGFALVEIDELGNCSIDALVSHCGDEPHCEVYFAGIALSPQRNVVSGYATGAFFLRDRESRCPGASGREELMSRS